MLILLFKNITDMLIVPRIFLSFDFVALYTKIVFNKMRIVLKPVTLCDKKGYLFNSPM